jgi:hypothetical protein
MSKKPIIKPRAVREETPQTPVQPVVRAVPRPTDDKRIRTKRDGSQVKQMTVYIPTELDRALRFHCADVDRDRVAVITDALSQYLKTNAA